MILRSSRERTVRQFDHYPRALPICGKSHREILQENGLLLALRQPKTKTRGKNPEKKTSGCLERKVTEAVLIQKRKPDLTGQVNTCWFL